MHQHFIHNQWTGQGETIDVVDPSTGETYDSILRGTAADVDAAVQSARAAFMGDFGKLTATERGRLLMKLSAKLIEHAEELAQIEARDCGKPLKQARADAAAIARYFEFYGGAADKLMGETIPYQNGYTVLTIREPYGVAAAIVPWNYPMQIFGRSVGGALAAGNTVVVKPAEDACLSLLRVAELARDVGFPAGTLNIVTGYGHEAGADLVAHPGVDHVSFTGSPNVGKLVVKAAIENHTPVTTELGGKSPQIVFEDADLEAMLPVVINAIVQNAGQTCSAGSRLLVQRSIYEKVIALLSGRFAQLKVGSSQMDLDCGPLIRKSQQVRVKSFLDDAQKDGLSIAAQGALADGAPANGFYQVPTLVRDVPITHRLAQEEVFGPVIAAAAFDTEEEAVALANGTDFGLVASVWTRDGGRQMRMARKIRAGQVFINNYGAGGGIELPFGGYKASGHGREKGFEALYGFTQLKTISMRHD
ncbi:aldehyde dehydrogenase family protein [Diaphorobacter aerolatus]|uniref:4-(hydroxymethyl)benzenesulfonate dehydrogenase n=1 Tax=Diaphorobacter aerolatus TaxID=1288495 RepID=A0A7H0GLL6_9BURK|nr:aldehyde dehydrogenase family protein [Diaphorobacter aerolatus]QNP49182.1 aldehyde dehydrogenase family protein [Diaphorobacter aerolatus]